MKWRFMYQELDIVVWWGLPNAHISMSLEDAQSSSHTSPLTASPADGKVVRLEEEDDQ